MNKAQLRQQIAELSKQIAELSKQIDRLESRNQFLEEQFSLAQQKQFGASSEGHPGQGELFNEAEEISYTRNKPKRKPLPKSLPREVVIHDIAQEDKVCACCHSELHKIGEDKSEKLEFIPAQVKVIEHVRPKYACRACEKDGMSNHIKQALMPPSVIPKGYATPSLLSQVITSKYQFGLPLYRQEAVFKQYGIELNRKTMADWMLKCADLLTPLYDRLHELILKQGIIAADETTLKVVSEDKAKCYMWVYTSGADSPEGKLPNTDIPNIVQYDYQPSRAGQCAVDYLQGYNGYLQVDGYAGYHKTQATLAGCWAHARRKFVEAKTAQGKQSSGRVDWALNHIRKLYRIETQIKASAPDERQKIRQEKSIPLLKKEHYKDSHL